MNSLMPVPDQKRNGVCVCVCVCGYRGRNIFWVSSGCVVVDIILLYEDVFWLFYTLFQP